MSDHEEEPKPQISADGRFRRIAPPEARQAEAPLRMPVPHRPRQPRRDRLPSPAVGRRRPEYTVVCTAGSRDSKLWDDQLWGALRKRLAAGDHIDVDSLTEDERRILRGQVALVRGRNPEGPPDAPPPPKPKRVRRKGDRTDSGAVKRTPGGAGAVDTELLQEAQLASGRIMRLEVDRQGWEAELERLQCDRAELETLHGQLLRERDERLAEGLSDSGEEVRLLLTVRQLDDLQQREATLRLLDKRRHSPSREVRELEGRLQKHAQLRQSPTAQDWCAAAADLKEDWPGIFEALGSGSDTAENRSRVMQLDLNGDGFVCGADLKHALYVLTDDRAWTDRCCGKVVRRVAEGQAEATAEQLLHNGAHLRDFVAGAVRDANADPAELLAALEQKKRVVDAAAAAHRRKQLSLARRLNRLQRELLGNRTRPSSPHEASGYLCRRKNMLAKVAELQRKQLAHEREHENDPELNPVEERILRGRLSDRRQAALLREYSLHHGRPGFGDDPSVPVSKELRLRRRWPLALGPAAVSRRKAQAEAADGQHRKRNTRLDTGQYGPRVPLRVVIAPHRTVSESPSFEEGVELAAVGTYEVRPERYRGQPVWGRVGKGPAEARVYRGGDGRWAVAVRDTETGQYNAATLQTAAAGDLPTDDGGVLQRYAADEGKWQVAAVRISAAKQQQQPQQPQPPPNPAEEWVEQPPVDVASLGVYKPPRRTPRPEPHQLEAETPTGIALAAAAARLRTVQKLPSRDGGPPVPARPKGCPPVGRPRGRVQAKEYFPNPAPLLSSALRHCPAPEDRVEDPLRVALLRAHRPDPDDFMPREYVPPQPAFGR